MKIEAALPSKILVNIYLTTWRHTQNTVIFTVTAMRTSDLTEYFWFFTNILIQFL
jgi:hypothetical protein